MDERFPTEDEELVIDGKRYRRVDSGYTFREYFSHSTDKGPGPGWDNRHKLLNPEYSERNFGQTFSEEQVENPALLPDDPMYHLEKIE